MRAAGSRDGSCNVINMEEARILKKQKTEEWLRQEIVKTYGDEDVLRNPLIRICVMFDNLSSEAQNELFGYAKGRILGFGQDIGLRDRLWSVLEKGGTRDGSWNDVEEFADELICRENIYKK